LQTQASRRNFIRELNTQESGGGYYGQFDIDQLDSRGSTTAAHEFGHMLGYFVDKGIPTVQSPGASENDVNSHAWKDPNPSKGIPDERGYIMNKSKNMDPSNRHVMDAEFSRLNGGNGVRLPTNIVQVEIVDPNKSRQYKDPLQK
jgi:hypothetical protein